MQVSGRPQGPRREPLRSTGPAPYIDLQRKSTPETNSKAWTPKASRVMGFLLRVLGIFCLVYLGQVLDSSIVGAGVSSTEIMQKARDVSTAAKDFVAVVTTCDLIVETLPAATKADRAVLIEGHFATTRDTGAKMPENLRVYLETELAKCNKPAKPKAKKAGEKQ